MFVLSEILWIIKCTFYLGDKCKKIRCQCANLITGALPIHVGCHAPSPLPLSVSRGFDYIKMNSRAFHKESETHFEWHWFLWPCNKGLFYRLLSVQLRLIPALPGTPPYRLTCDWHISFRDLLIETSVFNQQGVRATDWRGQIRFPKRTVKWELCGRMW